MLRILWGSVLRYALWGRLLYVSCKSYLFPPETIRFFDSFYFSWWMVRHFRMVACLVFSRLGKARGDGRVEYRLVDTGLNNLNGSGTQDALPFQLCEEVPCSNHKRLSLLLKGRT